MKIIFQSGRPAWSKGQYIVLVTILWIYTLLWLATLIAINLVVPLSGVTRVVITLVLVVFTPTDGHFMSYDKYRHWHAEHVVDAPGGDTG